MWLWGFGFPSTLNCSRLSFHISSLTFTFTITGLFLKTACIFKHTQFHDLSLAFLKTINQSHDTWTGSTISAISYPVSECMCLSSKLVQFHNMFKHSFSVQCPNMDMLKHSFSVQCL